MSQGPMLDKRRSIVLYKKCEDGLANSDILISHEYGQYRAQ